MTRYNGPHEDTIDNYDDPVDYYDDIIADQLPEEKDDDDDD